MLTDGSQSLPGRPRLEHRMRHASMKHGQPVIARRGTEHGSDLGTQRWIVERAFAHLHRFRRLRIRWELRDDIHEAFRTLGCALIC